MDIFRDFSGVYLSVRKSDDRAREEVFGPIIGVTVFEEEAVALANHIPKAPPALPGSAPPAATG